MHAHRQPDSSFRVAGALALSVLCFSSVPLFLKHFVGFLDAWTVNGIRYGVATLFWLPFVIRFRRDVPRGRNPWRDALFPAAINILGQIGWALLPYYIDVSIIAFVIRCSFLVTILFGFSVLPAERPLARQRAFWIGVALSIGGIALMYGGSFRQVHASPVGWLILALTTIFWGMYGVSVKRHMDGYSVRLSFGIISLYTTAALLVLMFALGDWTRAAALSPATAGLLAASALIGIAFSHVLLYTSIRVLGPVVTDGGALATPFLTTFGAWLFFGEHMHGAQWLAGCAIIAGSLLLIVARRRLRTPTPELPDA